MTQPSTINFGVWTLHRESGELERGGNRVRLQDLPFQILDELLSRPGEVVTREQLITRLWPKTVVDFDGNLNSGVRRLRAALGDDADAPRYIETLPRKGYRYIGDAPRHDAPVGRSETPEARIGRGRRLAWAGAIALIAVAGAVAAVYLTRDRTDRSEPELRSAGAAIPSLRLAVLPFENLSPDPANAFFADGMHEEIITSISSRAPNLEVISRTTMMMYRAKPKSVRDVARELNVTHVLEGSVRREGASVRLTLQLIDTRRDSHLWSKNYDRQLSDTLALQSAVAEEVSSQLAVKLSGNIGELPPPANPDAYDLYLKARLAMLTIDGMRSPREQGRALELLDRSIALDDAFAAAYLQRARVRMASFTSSQDVSEASLAALRADLAAARRMMGDAPPLLVTESQYAQLVDFESDKALRLLARAQVINPHSSEVCHYLARALGTAGRRDESLAYYRQASELDPGNPSIHGDWASALKMEGRAEESLRRSRDFEARYPGLATYGWRLFGFSGQLERARRDTALLEAAGDQEAMLAANFELLRYSQRLNELPSLIEQSRLETIRQTSFGRFTIPAIGRKPVAELHGWASLLVNDPISAARDGRTLLNFVAREPVTKWNGWHLRMLAAEGALFTGDKARAVSEVRAALGMAPQDVHPGIQRYGRALAARIFAWAGAHDESIALLERLSTEYPMIGPAEITRDPLYTIPLAANSRYRELESRLIAEIAQNQKWKDPD
jgi:TolB-like protein/DNA-binding winged helix-turn-helix (wHTH) protein/Flp pilus assembly protein TadD